MIELLAPAKNKEQGIAAINHGADAVYIAGPCFGARESAGNSIKDIAALADYSHKYYAKTYMVLNTILYDNELEQAYSLINEAYSAGVDALIIQDMGVLEMDLPPLPLFASTQTNNCTPEKVSFLEKVGFQRVILARELNLKEIQDISNKCSVELEAFVHGSLCVSYSGKCYISQAISGRSANRGTCAQYCRLPYDLINDKGQKLATQKHLLSLKDLNLSDYLEELINSGISSFKIEGRLKDLSYVKNVTALYRKNIDSILEKRPDLVKASSGKVITTFEPDSEKSFSRGFTTYFLKERQRGLSAESSKSRGKFIGKIKILEKTYFTLDCETDLKNGDGICFFNNNGQLNGTRINKVQGLKIYPLNIKGLYKGLKLFCNYDYLFDRKLAGDTAKRHIEARLFIYLEAREIKIKVQDEDGVCCELNFKNNGEPAINSERAIESLRRQITKTGDSHFSFVINKIEGDIFFFQISVINAWRRDLIKALEIKRELQRNRNFYKIIKNNIPYPESNLDYTTNVSNKLAKDFYLRHGVEKISPAFELKSINNASLMFNRYCIKYEMGMCPKQGAKTTGNLFLQYRDKKIKLIFDCKLCEMKMQLFENE